ncbi:MAG: primase catalytic core, N-terminal domain, partial [Naasia sp.]|nr:primase catalytic core, N-terminal domain [Naasia sp.]
GPGAVPVIVEGPIDAIAVTLASAGRYLGVAPLGTGLSDEQANQLAAITRHAGHDPMVATDADLAGQIAAERDFWMLTPHGLDPGYVRFPDGLDPADVFAQRGPAALTAALTGGKPLGEKILSERLDNLDPEQAGVAAMRVLAARPSHAWDSGTEQILTRLQVTQLQVRRDLRDAVKVWDADPRTIAQDEMHSITEVRRRLEAAAAKSPAERWAPLARQLDSRLLEQSDWPATAAILQQVHEEGHDINTVTRALVDEAPLSYRPAADLRYRIVSHLQIGVDTGETPNPRTSPSTGIAQEQRETPVHRPPQPGSPQR